MDFHAQHDMTQAMPQETTFNTVRFLVDPRPSELTTASLAAFIARVAACCKLYDYSATYYLISYLMRLREQMYCCSSCYILGGVYVRRFIQKTTGAPAHDCIFAAQSGGYGMLDPQLQHLALVALTVAAKYFDDVFHTNKHYAEAGGISCPALNALEQRFLSVLDYDLYVTHEEFELQVAMQNYVLSGYYRCRAMTDSALCCKSPVPCQSRATCTSCCNCFQPVNCSVHEEYNSAAKHSNESSPPSELHMIGVPVATVVVPNKRFLYIPFSINANAPP